MAAVTAAILGIAGCYGQTDLATNVGQHGATLNARGTANNGAADVFFEYWKDSTPQTKLQTQTKTGPGGSSGAFDQAVSGLDDNTAYSFRLCGKDQSSAGGPVCAQTRSFRTGSASVRVVGGTDSPFGENSLAGIDINVSTSPLGGRVFAHWRYGGPGGPPGGISFDVGSATTDNVTCLNVEGNVAVIGFKEIPGYPDTVPLKNQNSVIVVDGGAAGSGKDQIAMGPTTAVHDPNDCSIPDTFTGTPLRRGDASVSGTTSNPTLR